METRRLGGWQELALAHLARWTKQELDLGWKESAEIGRHSASRRMQAVSRLGTSSQAAPFLLCIAQFLPAGLKWMGAGNDRAQQCLATQEVVFSPLGCWCAVAGLSWKKVAASVGVALTSVREVEASGSAHLFSWPCG